MKSKLKLNASQVTISQVALAVMLALGSQTGMAEEEILPEYTFWDSVKEGKSLSSIRGRYENVDQDAFQQGSTVNKLREAHAFTTRSLIGWQTAPYKNFSIAAQITDVHEFNDNFNDRRKNQPEHDSGTGISGIDKRKYPNVVDPGFTDVNQLFVDWTGIKNTKFRLGRQVVNLDNVRFVGDIAFRQNTQVFDGVTVVNKTLPDTEIFAGLFNRVRQINTELREANIQLVNAKYRFTPTESLTGYGYMIDADNLSQNGGNPAAAGFAAAGGNGLGGSSDVPASATNVNPFATDASSKTFGLRLDGVHPFNPNWRALYTAEYAKQDDYRGGSPLIDAFYYKVGGGFGYNTFTARFDIEKLSTNGGKYAFQTPMGTNHLFQGWADHFLTTPKQGIEDYFITLNGKLDKFVLYAEYHVFKSDTRFQSVTGLGDKYGTEFDASVMYPFNDKLWAKVEYANFNEADVYGGFTNAARKGDKEIIWLTTQLSF